MVTIGSVTNSTYNRAVTTKEQLHELVDRLSDEQVDELLRLAEEFNAESKESSLPSFVGMGHSGHGHLGRQAKAILRTELEPG